MPIYAQNYKTWSTARAYVYERQKEDSPRESRDLYCENKSCKLKSSIVTNESCISKQINEYKVGPVALKIDRISNDQRVKCGAIFPIIVSIWALAQVIETGLRTRTEENSNKGGEWTHE